MLDARCAAAAAAASRSEPLQWAASWHLRWTQWTEGDDERTPYQQEY